MIDGTSSRQEAFNYVSTIENVKILDYKEKASLGLDSELEIWEVETEVLFNNTPFPIVLHIVFPTLFPIGFPRIFLSPETFERTKYIPHVNTERFVCTYDTEISSTNVNEPAGIVVECIWRSKRIILDGLSKNDPTAFDDEFKAYWEGKYGKEKYLPQTVLSLINEIHPETNIKLICLKHDIGHFEFVLHASDETALRFKEVLNDYKYEYHETNVYFIREFPPGIPPYDLTNRDVINIIRSTGIESLERFKSFINNKKEPKLVVCQKQIGLKSYLFGWFHEFINTNLNGFRPGALKQFMAISTNQSNKNVNRITTDVFTKERLENRTSGKNDSRFEKTFLIAGVGSIGSNLIYFLNSINSPNFKLVDTDILRLENIQRHFLGFESIGCYKTKALKDYIIKNNPLQKVTTKEISIIDIINSEAEYLNDADYIFSCIGNANIDNCVCQSLKEGIINKPIFIIWVEPFLCGGHCLYLHPSNPDFENYFEEDLFRFNVIDNSEYKSGNNELSLREAGCQTTYIPYSGYNVISFISSLFSLISSIIESDETNSSAYTWVGNIAEVNKKIKISSYYKIEKVGAIIEHKL